MLPNDAWYRVEVIIFERIADVDPASTQEVVVSHAPRTYPLDVFAFDDDANRSAAYPLDAETRAQPPLPTSASTAASRPFRRSAAAPATPTAAEHAAKLVADYQAQLQGRSYKFEPSNTFLLASEDGRLQRSNVYRVVFHRAWIQPVPDRDQLRPMLIQIREPSDGRTAHRRDSRRYARALSAPRRATLVRGDMRIRRRRRRIRCDAEEPRYMELREQRRMRSGELHYLDHPKLGVLARVDPIAPPETLLAELARLGAPQAAPAAPAQ